MVIVGAIPAVFHRLSGNGSVYQTLKGEESSRLDAHGVDQDEGLAGLG